MLVKCIANNLSALEVSDFTKNELKLLGVGGINGSFHLKMGMEYVVFGVTYKFKIPFYYVCDECFSYYPMAYVASAFTILDDRLSKYWRYSITSYEGSGDYYTKLVFKEWANDEYYYDRLTNNNPADVKLFAAYREKMLIEYSIPSIQDVAIYIDDNWVMCQSCDETWQESGCNEMTWCAKCKKIMRLLKIAS